LPASLADPAGSGNWIALIGAGEKRWPILAIDGPDVG